MESTNLSRRAFLRGRSPKFNPATIHPPWTVETSEFIQNCERCDQCIDACPENILFRGDGGFPTVNFKFGECTFCKKCANTCNANAFKHEDLNENNAWPLFANINSTCLSLNAIVCRTCGDTCDADAIHFKLQTRGVSIPIVNTDLCIGCGACLYTCPKNAISMLQDR